MDIISNILLILVSIAPCALSSRSEHPAITLLFDLMTKSRYNPLVKPAGEAGGGLTVKLGMRLSQLLDVDEKKQVISLSVWLRHEWKDLRLTWDPESYGGVKKLYVPSGNLWRPDIVLYNNADGDFVITQSETKATVWHDGVIIWEPPAIYKSYCPINVEFFPFDVQDCFLKFGSWTYNGHEVDLQHMCSGVEVEGIGLVIADGIDIDNFQKNAEWDVLNVTARRREKFYACCKEDPYPDIMFNITLRRRTLFYTLNLIMPCISISGLTVLVFYLPSDSGEKITLSISILLALTVFFLLLSDINPPTSLVIPLIGKYLLFIMIVVTMSIFLTVYTLHINFKTPSTQKMSPWVRRLFTQILPSILMMKRPDLDNKSKLALTDFNDEEETLKMEVVGGSRDPQVYENVRQQSEEPEDERDFSPDVQDALIGVKFIADHMRNSDEENSEIRDWKYIAMVMDRFFLYIFAAATLSGTVSIFLYAPSLYDGRHALHGVHNSTCIY